MVPHPVKRRAGVEAAGERDADFLAGGQVFEDGAHGLMRAGAAYPKWQM
jgi:hypothetical protein